MNGSIGLQPPLVSVVMVAFDGGWEWVARALDALRRNTPEPYEVILIDNGGRRDRSIGDDTDVEIIRNDANIGFGPASNQGAAHGRGEVICFLNADALVEPGWLPPLLDRLADTRVGAVVPKKLNIDGSLQEAGAFVTGEAHAYVFGDGDDPDATEHNFARYVDFGSAACMAFTRNRFASTGGFDPAYRLAYFEDADLCFRLREDGVPPLFEPRSRVTHVRTVSADATTLAGVYGTNRDVFLSRWAAAIAQRPTFEQLRDDVRIRLAARDLHASDRILLVDGGDTTTQRVAAELASAHPSARVTLLTDQTDLTAHRRLLTAGVEVVSGVREDKWLSGRAGHYSHVVTAQNAGWLRLRTLIEETQPQAGMVDLRRLERAARAGPLAELMRTLRTVG
jgi:GT2 family glycosyltransferase